MATNNKGIVQTVTYVNGQAVHKMSEGGTIAQIDLLQKKVVTLKALKIKSTTVDKKVKELEGAISVLIEHLDSDAVGAQGSDASDGQNPSA